jgi:predicted RNA-binding protein with PIN domain
MAHILIDGYNLIGIAHDNLESARNNLLHDLKDYSELKNHEITVVFDGWKSGNREQTRIRSRHVTVIYTRIGDTADVVMQRMLTPGTKPWIVVTSDRAISDVAEKRGFAAVTSEEFEEKLFKALNRIRTDSIPDFRPDEYGPDTPQEFRSKRGSSRQRSRREKKKLQALKKL